MAIWQWRVTFVPENALLRRFGVLPPRISRELADSSWWSDYQPVVGFEQQIGLILAERASWSTSMQMWGQEDGNDAYVCYVDGSKNAVEEIAFRIDAGAVSSDLLRRICVLAKQLKCVLLTSDYEILAPDEEMVLTAINRSTAKGYVDDPVSTLRSLGRPEVQERFNNPMKDERNSSPRKADQ